MTFEEFQQHCNLAVSGKQPVLLPCPIVIGDGDIHAALGDTPDHPLVVFKMPPDNAALQSIYQSVRFGFDIASNQVAITPVTTGG